MKKIYKNRKDEDAVSPVIATILMVAITVVLAAVLYVMVINMGGTSTITTPLGLNQQSRTSSTVNILVSNAPNGAKIDGTSVAVDHGGTPTAVSTVTVYTAAADVMATYSGGTWTYSGNYTANTAEFTSGVIIVVDMGTGTTISTGDVITFSSSQDYYGTTTFTVS